MLAVTSEAKTYEDCLREARSVSKERLQELYAATAFLVRGRRGSLLDFKPCGSPSGADVKYFANSRTDG